MFCGECGTKNDEGTKFCGNCGATIEQPAASNIPAANNSENIDADFSIGNFAHFSAPAGGHAKLKIGGMVLHGDIIFKGLAIALFAVLLILPFLVHGFYVRGYSSQVSRHLFQHMTGPVGTLLSLLVLLTPIALFCLFQFKNKIPVDAGLQFIVVIALSVFGFIMPLIVRARIFAPLRALHDNRFMTVIYWIRPTFGFILTLLLYVVVAVIAFGFMQAASKNKASLPK